MTANLKKECADCRFNCFGTSKIFQRRANIYQRNRNLITFLGLVVPLVIGATALSFSTQSDVFKKIMLPLAGGFTILQLVVSLWALVSRWDEKYSYATVAIKENTRMETEFNRLANASDGVLKKEIKKVREEYNRLNAEDTAHGVSKKEIRYGYRAALIHYQVSCPTCNNQPQSMAPSKCDICGNFPRRFNL